jgi:hypothetical protein
VRDHIVGDRRQLKLRNLSFLRLDRVDNLLKAEARRREKIDYDGFSAVHPVVTVHETIPARSHLKPNRVLWPRSSRRACLDDLVAGRILDIAETAVH